MTGDRFTERGSVARIPQDYHLHSYFSPDSRQSMVDICERAIERGITEISITDHADYIEYADGDEFYNPAGYFQALEQVREQYEGRLIIRAGVEIGEPHRFADRVDALLDSYPYDFVIGSLHWVGDRLILSSDYFEGRDVEESYRAYYTEMLEMVSTGRFDIVGHIDVGKRYGYDAHGFYDVTPYEDQLREIYRVLVQRGKGIEINQGSVRRNVQEPAPNATGLQWYREEGGEILTLGSDGHRTDAVGYCLETAIDMARSVGFTGVTGYQSREPFHLSFDD
jgi:histidinol-phosphatase (PHP family)